MWQVSQNTLEPTAIARGHKVANDMIISDRYKLAFIHIPKCAGTSVRSQLASLDDRDGMFDSRVDEHPTLGQLDYVHIPLKILKAHFPEEFSCLCSYQTFAITRDIHDRFASALAQYCDYQTDTPIKRHSQKSLTEQAYQIIERLEALRQSGECPDLLPADLIHFQPQRDYVYCGDDRIVETLIPIEEVDQYLSELLFARNMLPVAAEANASVAYRNSGLRLLSNMANRVVRAPGRFVPESFRPAVRAMIYASESRKVSAAFDDKTVRDFVSEFYKRDDEMRNR